MNRYNHWINEIFDIDKPLKMWQSIAITLVVLAMFVTAIVLLCVLKGPEI